MRLLVIGSGGREHALVWKLAQSVHVERIFSAPGNPGTALIEKNKNVSIQASDLDALVNFASTEGVDLTVVGPEKPLAEGIVDRFLERNLLIFGPTQGAAQLEASKSFAKQLMVEARVPTAQFEVLTSHSSALDYVKRASYPLVLKADGLAAGKGVLICNNSEMARTFVEDCMQNHRYAKAGAKIVAEEFLSGEEVSFMVIAHGTEFISLQSSQDHKRLLDGERGPNTGGMGAYCPVPVFTPELQRTTEENVVRPVLRRLSEKGTPFSGLLYVGLMITPKGPCVLEFNVRFGDPETQALLPQMNFDLAQLFLHAARGRIPSKPLDWSPQATIAVVLAAQGYPDAPVKGSVISHLSPLSRADGVVFHAGTRQKGQTIVTDGGRVFTVCAWGDTLRMARSKAYEMADQIQFEGKQYRSDIGWRVLGNSAP